MARNNEVTISNEQSRDTYKQTLEKTEGPIKTNKTQTTTQKSKNMGNTDPTNQSGEPRNPGSRKRQAVPVSY